MEDAIFDLLMVQDTHLFCFYYKCKESQCDYDYLALIETAGELGVCKAFIWSHIMSHYRPF